MDSILIDDLEVFFRIGVPDDERARPQRLLISVELFLDTSGAARTDDLSMTVDYFALAGRIRALGGDREWKLIETLAAEVAELVLTQPKVCRVAVEISKFIIPDTRRIALRIQRSR